VLRMTGRLLFNSPHAAGFLALPLHYQFLRGRMPGSIEPDQIHAARQPAAVEQEWSSGRVAQWSSENTATRDIEYAH